MACRADELCDLAKGVIEEAGGLRPLAGTTVSVTCDDDPEVDPDGLTVGTMYVLIWWESYADGGPAARGVDYTDYRLSFLVVEKCDDAGAVSSTWRRDRSEWVDECIVRALGNGRDLLDGAYAMTLEDVSLDQDALQYWLFWTKVTIVFRDERVIDQ